MKKFLSVLLALSMLLTMLPAAVLSEGENEAPAPAATEAPTKAPTPEPTKAPTPEPTKEPTPEPTQAPTPEPTKEPTPEPTPEPTKEPTPEPTQAPTPEPTEAPTEAPTAEPTEAPTQAPTEAPAEEPIEKPEEKPTEAPEAAKPEITLGKLRNAQVKNGTAAFTVNAEVTGAEQVSYQWQELDEAALKAKYAGRKATEAEREAAWENLKGKTGKTLKLEGITADNFASYANKTYRCVVKADDVKADDVKAVTNEAVIKADPAWTETEEAPDAPEADVEEAPEAPDAPEADVEEAPEAPVTPEADVEEAPEAPAAPEADVEDTPEAPAVPEVTVEETPEVPTEPEATKAEAPKAPAVPEADVEKATEAPAVPVVTKAEAPAEPAKAQTDTIASKEAGVIDSFWLGLTGQRMAQAAPDSFEISISVGETIPRSVLNYYAKDAEGHVVENCTFTFTTPSSDLVTVGSDGSLKGKATGNAIVAVKADGKVGRFRVRVRLAANSVSLDRTALSLRPSDAPVVLTAASLPAVVYRPLTWNSSDPAVAAVDNGVVTPKAIGETTITVRTANGLTANCKVTVCDEASQGDLSLTGPDHALTVGEEAALKAEFAPFKVAQITRWDSSDPAVVTVDQTGKVTAAAPGTATVTVTADNGVTAACELSVRRTVDTFWLGLTGQQMTQAAPDSFEISITVNDTIPVNVLDYFARDTEGNIMEGCAFTFTTSNPKVVTVAADGALRGVATGTANVAVRADGKIGRFRVRVRLAANTVSLDQKVLSLRLSDAPVTLTAASLPAVAWRPLTWSSSDPAVAAVDNGVITPRAVGETTVTVRTSNNLTANCKVTVCDEAAQGDLSISGAPGQAVTVGTEVTLTPVFAPYKVAQIARWDSSDPAVAAVDQGGKVTAAAPGTAIVTVTADNGVTASCEVSVRRTVDTFWLGLTGQKMEAAADSSFEISISVGETIPRSVLGYYVADTEGEIMEDCALTFTTPTSSLISIAADGSLTGKATGNAIVAVKADGKAGRFRVSVRPAPTAITLPGEVSISVDDAGEHIPAVLTPAAAYSPIRWLSSDPDIVAVDEAGTLIPVSAGTATVTATTFNNKTDSCTVHVLRLPQDEGEVIFDQIYMSVGQTRKLVPLFAEGVMAPVSRYFVPEYFRNIISVDEYGNVTAADELPVGYDSVDAVVCGYTGNNILVSGYVTVSGPTAQILTGLLWDGDELNIAVGETVTFEQLDARACDAAGHPTGETVTAGSTNLSVFTANANGRITLKGKAAGTANLVLKTVNNVQKVIRINVTAAPTSITLPASVSIPLLVDNDEIFEIHPTFRPAGYKGVLSVTVADGSVAQASDYRAHYGCARIVPVGVGSTTVTITTFNGLSASCTVNVLPAPADDTEAWIEDLVLSQDEVMDTRDILRFAEGRMSGIVSVWTDDIDVLSAESFYDLNRKIWLLVPHGKGTTTLHVTVYGENQSLVELTGTVTVLGAPADILSRQIGDSTVITIGVGQQVGPAALGFYAVDYDGEELTAPVTYVLTGSTAYASLDANTRMLKGLAVGKATLKASVTASGSTLTKVYTVKVVNATNLTVRLDPDTLEFFGATDESGSYIDPVEPQRANAICTLSALTWTSADPEIASVDKFGNVTVLKPGQTTVTAKTFKGKSAVLNVYAYAEPEIFTLEADTNYLVYGGDPITVRPGEAGRLAKLHWLKWDPSSEPGNPYISVDQRGVVTALRPVEEETDVQIIAECTNGASASLDLVLVPQPTGIRLDRNTAILARNSKVEVGVNVMAGDLVLTKVKPTAVSSRPDMVYYDDGWIFTRVNGPAGEADITFTLGDLSEVLHVRVDERADIIRSNTTACVDWTEVTMNITATGFDPTGVITHYQWTHPGAATPDPEQTEPGIKVPFVQDITGWAVGEHELTFYFEGLHSVSLSGVDYPWGGMMTTKLIITEDVETDEISYRITEPGRVTVKGFTDPADKQTVTELTVPTVVEVGGHAYTVTEICANAFESSVLQTVHLPNTITRIGEAAFRNCTSLSQMDSHN